MAVNLLALPSLPFLCACAGAPSPRARARALLIPSRALSSARALVVVGVAEESGARSGQEQLSQERMVRMSNVDVVTFLSWSGEFVTREEVLNSAQRPVMWRSRGSEHGYLGFTGINHVSDQSRIGSARVQMGM
ncbi:hypothetical protein NDU88_004891 [Pleurodeles waltl]|uniref:Uncharacterized protein n=1 Tax=Pleurodeles waltl TaxID=8319 RepID=A0AAV7MVW8_PLEWA|nr:hypothetical protein NDU88_004891 [Pleurodeles waltl]